MERIAFFPEPTALYGMGEITDWLDKTLLYEEQSVLLKAPHGSGKSTLLKRFFTLDRRREYAKKKRLLITAPDTFPVGLTYNEVFAYFTDLIKTAAFIVLQHVSEQDFLVVAQAGMNAGALETSDGKLNMLVQTLNSLDYKVAIVLDGFENFTSSETVKREHHGILNSLVDKFGLRFVVATDYDLSAESRTAEGADSYLLQKFGSGEKALPPLDDSAAVEYAGQLCADWGREYNEGYVDWALVYSGGRPYLFSRALAALYNNECDDEEQMSANAERELYDNCSRVLEKWCGALDDRHLHELKTINEQDDRPHISTDILRNRRAVLESRGLIVSRDGRYEYSCLLLEIYCENMSLRKDAAEEERRLFRELMQNVVDGQNDGIAGKVLLLNAEHQAMLMEEIFRRNNMKSPVSEEEYEALGLCEADRRLLDDRMKVTIDEAIQNCRDCMLLTSVVHEERDYGLQLFGFTRAFECQLKSSLYRLMLFIHRHTDGDMLALISKDCNRANCSLRDFPTNGYETLSTFHCENFMRNTARELSALCESVGDEGLKALTPAWWREFADDIANIRRQRNDVTHNLDPFSYEETRNILDVMFKKHRMVDILKAKQLADILNAR